MDHAPLKKAYDPYCAILRSRNQKGDTLSIRTLAVAFLGALLVSVLASAHPDLVRYGVLSVVALVIMIAFFRSAIETYGVRLSGYGRQWIRLLARPEYRGAFLARRRRERAVRR